MCLFLVSQPFPLSLSLSARLIQLLDTFNAQSSSTTFLLLSLSFVLLANLLYQHLDQMRRINTRRNRCLSTPYLLLSEWLFVRFLHEGFHCFQAFNRRRLPTDSASTRSTSTTSSSPSSVVVVVVRSYSSENTQAWKSLPTRLCVTKSPPRKPSHPLWNRIKAHNVYMSLERKQSHHDDNYYYYYKNTNNDYYYQ